MKLFTITSAFIAIFSGLAGAFFKMFHMPLGNEMLITSLVLSVGAAFGMILMFKKHGAENTLKALEPET